MTNPLLQPTFRHSSSSTDVCPNAADPGHREVDMMMSPSYVAAGTLSDLGYHGLRTGPSPAIEGGQQIYP